MDSTTTYVKHKRISLKRHPVLNEKWVQERLIEDPSLLGLGDLEVRAVERTQPQGGRLDLLLYDPETTTRYEVELQLGPTDESHIIRTIEYWDIERRRYPQYDHVAVIVAEDITARFFNVISLFNGFIPIIAIQLNAIEVGDALTLVCTTVLDRVQLGLDEDDAGTEPADRSYWEAKASPATVGLVDQLLGTIREVDPSAALKYNRHYIGLTREGQVTNYIVFRPRKQHVLVECKIPRSDQLTEQIEQAGLDQISYDTRWGSYKIQVNGSDLGRHTELLRDLVTAAHEHHSD